MICGHAAINLAMVYHIASASHALLCQERGLAVTNGSSHSIPQHRTPSERWVNDWTRSQHHVPLRSFVPSAPHCPELGHGRRAGFGVP